MKSLSRMLSVFPLQIKEGGIVFIGDVFSKFLTFLITIILLQLVSPVEYALYGVFITALAAINQFSDSGLHQSFIRFYALYQTENIERATTHLWFAYRLKWVILIITGITVYAGSDFLASTIFLMPELEYPLRLLSVGVIGSGIFEFMQAVFQAKQEFNKLTFLRVSEGVGKLSFILFFIWIHQFSLQIVFLAYVVVPIIVGAAGIYLVGSNKKHPDVTWKDIGTEIFTFGKWMMLTSFATMFLMRLDIFMITPMLSHAQEEIGLYAAAVRLCTPLIVLTGSVSTVFFPKAMSIRTLAEMRSYISKSLKVTIPLVFLSGVYLVCLYIITPLYFPNYIGSLPLFSILVIGYAWTIIGNPLTMLVLSINKAQVVTYISFGQLVLTVISHYYFILFMGAIGAAISTVLLWFIAGIVSMWYLYHNRYEIERIGRKRC